MKDKGRTRYLILGLLAEGPCSGYDIRRITMLRFRFFWSESFGQIYPCLKQLAADGLIERQAAEGRGKVIWAITAAGRLELGRWLAGDTQAETARYEAILKFYFSWAMAAADSRRLLEEFRQRQTQNLQELAAFKRELETIPDPHGNHYLALATIDLGLATHQAWQDWAKRQLAAGSTAAPAGDQIQGEKS